MDYKFISSLKGIVLTKIAVTLVHREEYRFSKSIQDPRIPSTMPDTRTPKDQLWFARQNYVFQLADYLPLPPLIRKELKQYIAGVGYELYLWWCLHIYCPRSRLFNHISWTAQGTVDKRKTALNMVEDKQLTIKLRFQIACTYCLEGHIHSLFKQKYSHLSSGQPMHYPPPFINQRDKLIRFWCYYAHGVLQPEIVGTQYNRRSSSITNWEDAFYFSVFTCNEVAARFFFEKFTAVDKQRLILTVVEQIVTSNEWMNIDIVPPQYRAGILCFLLQSMSKNHQMELFSYNYYLVLRHFLKWPFQCYFMETVNLLWDTLPAEHFYNLLVSIKGKMSQQVKDIDYQKLLQEFWWRSPSSHKKYVIYNSVYMRPVPYAKVNDLISELFQMGDQESIELILNNASVSEKELFILGEHGKSICEDLILADNWKMLRFFVLRCVSSRKTALELRNKFSLRRMLTLKISVASGGPSIVENLFSLIDELLETLGN